MMRVRERAIEVVILGSGEVTLKVNNHRPATITHYAAENLEKKQEGLNGIHERRKTDY